MAGHLQTQKLLQTTERKEWANPDGNVRPDPQAPGFDAGSPSWALITLGTPWSGARYSRKACNDGCSCRTIRTCPSPDEQCRSGKGLSFRTIKQLRPHASYLATMKFCVRPRKDGARKELASSSSNLGTVCAEIGLNRSHVGWVTTPQMYLNP